MKKILLATDYSMNCQAAFDYSLNMAMDTKAELEIFNSYVPIPAIGIDGGTGVINDGVIESNIQTNLFRLRKWWKVFPINLRNT